MKKRSWKPFLQLWSFTCESRAKPEFKGSERLRIRSKPERRGEAREWMGEGSGEGLNEPLPRNFLKNRIWNHCYWCIFDANIWNKWQLAVRDYVQLPTFMKKSILHNYLMWGNCSIVLKYKHVRGSGGLRPPEAEAFMADKVVIKAVLVHILRQHFNLKTWFESM